MASPEPDPDPNWCPICGEPIEVCRAMGHSALDDDDDGYPYDEEDFDDEDPFDFDCAMDARGNCGKAGSEECDWECPYRNVKRN